MRRRDILRRIGSGVVILSVASGRAAATVENQREAAIDYVSNEHGVPEENLQVLVKSIASWNTLGEDYYQAKIHDAGNQRMYRVLLDGNGDEVDRSQLHNREEKAYRQKYGKFSPDFSERLSNSDHDDKFEAKVRLKSESIDRRQAVKDVVENTDDNTDTNRRLKEKLSEARTNAIREATARLADKLSNLPSTTIISKGKGTSTVIVDSTKEDLQDAATITDVWRIYRTKTPQATPDQHSATRTINASDGDPLYDLSGVPLGVLEINHPNEYVEANIAGTRYSQGEDGHPTMVTECAAGTDRDLPGTAHNADVYFADNYNAEPEDEFVTWFDNNNVTAFNLSASTNYCDRYLHRPDLDYEESVYNHNMNFVTSAGNQSNCDNLEVRTPAKGFNAISVGAIDDNNTGGDRSDDTLWDNSCRINPMTRNSSDNHYPHQKPEVSAVGARIDTPWNTFETDDSLQELNDHPGDYEEAYGTSFAAPNVTGLIAILEDNFGGIADAPDTAKAVAMAGATHDLGGYTRNEHGAGCVDVDAALHDILFSQHFITDIFYESNNAQDYSIDLEAGDTVDISLVWRSDANQAGFTDLCNAQSDINLGLYLYHLNGDLMAADTKYDRAWQLIEGGDEGINIQETGSYDVKVWNSRWEADESHREFTIAWRIYQ